MSFPTPTMTTSWADEVTEELHPSLPRVGDKYDILGRNMSAQLRREKAWGRWVLVKYSKRVY